MRFTFIAAKKAEHTVTILCRCLCVTRSGFYAWQARPEWRCCMNTRCGWGGVARTSRDPPQEPHYGDEVEGSSHV